MFKKEMEKLTLGILIIIMVIFAFYQCCVRGYSPLSEKAETITHEKKLTSSEKDLNEFKGELQKLNDSLKWKLENIIFNRDIIRRTESRLHIAMRMLMKEPDNKKLKLHIKVLYKEIEDSMMVIGVYKEKIKDIEMNMHLITLQIKETLKKMKGENG